MDLIGGCGSHSRCCFRSDSPIQPRAAPIKPKTAGIARLSRDIDGLWIVAIDVQIRGGLAHPAAESVHAQSAPISIDGCTRSCAPRRVSRSIHLILRRSAPGSAVGNASACLLQLAWGAQTVTVRTGPARATMRTGSIPHCWSRHRRLDQRAIAIGTTLLGLPSMIERNSASHVARARCFSSQ